MPYDISYVSSMPIYILFFSHWVMFITSKYTLQYLILLFIIFPSYSHLVHYSQPEENFPLDDNTFCHHSLDSLPNLRSIKDKLMSHKKKCAIAPDHLSTHTEAIFFPSSMRILNCQLSKGFQLSTPFGLPIWSPQGANSKKEMQRKERTWCQKQSRSAL